MTFLPKKNYRYSTHGTGDIETHLPFQTSFRHRAAISISNVKAKETRHESAYNVEQLVSQGITHMIHSSSRQRLVTAIPWMNWTPVLVSVLDDHVDHGTTTGRRG